MKNLLVAVVVVLAAHSATGAIQYDFYQANRSDVEPTPPTECIGRGVIDGDRIRLDFTSGTAFPPGTYMLSVDGGRKLTFVDPMQKSFTEVNAVGVASAIGTAGIKIDNLKHETTRIDDTQTIAGIPAEHHRVVITYDIAVSYRSMLLKQGVRTVIDRWSTMRFGDIDAGSFENMPTGNPQIDELIAAESGKLRGFPLKQVVQVTVTSRMPRPSNSQLKIPEARTITRETTVTRVAEVPAQSALFVVPPEFRRAEVAQAEKAPVEILALEPEGK